MKHWSHRSIMVMGSAWAGLAALGLVACGGGAPLEPEPCPPRDRLLPPIADGDVHDASDVPDWVTHARVGGADINHFMTEAELRAVLTARRDQNVSVVELDTRLSEFLSDREFEVDVEFLDRAATIAHELGMRAVIYYPSLEVLTPGGADSPFTMGKLHPEWLQHGLDGTPNVFYGTLEHWVDPDAESAWMSPNTGYRDYLIERVKKLARTSLDGVWLDVPVYLETGTPWPGAEPAAAEAFRAWTVAHGLACGEGYDVPTAVSHADPAFRAWVRWRHENLAAFLEDIRREVHAVNPDFMIIIENFPVDNVDATSAGLDGNFRVSGKNFIRVWEIDSVSNTQAMKWATYEDFNSKIAMNKYAKAAERRNQTWVFSYGFEPLDVGLTMAAAVTVGVAPFEANTPEMVKSADPATRTRWFGFLAQHSQALLATERHAEVGVWYSTATRDYVDLPEGGAWGMYPTEEPPTDDPDWWATDVGDTFLPKPHMGGWRGAAHVLTQLGIPFTVVTDPGNPAQYLEPLKVLWLPSVAAMSDESAQLIRDFVARGGTLLATGKAPATLDELGGQRPESALADVFGWAPGEAPGDLIRPYGDGYVVYRPEIWANHAFVMAHDWFEGHGHTSDLQQLLRLMTPDLLRFDVAPGVHVEVAKPSGTRHYLYVLNYTGLQGPLVQNVVDILIDYRPPAGMQVVQAEVFSPDAAGQIGLATVRQRGRNLQGVEVRVDQFALIALDLAPAPPEVIEPYVRPTLPPAWREPAQSGLAFILNKMRNPEHPEPYSFGVFTNLIDDPDVSEIYAHGHHVTAEHMGLLLRVAACLGETTVYEQTYRYVRDVMVAPFYNVINWAVDSKRLQPFIELDEDYTPWWKHGNAPLDDFRVIRGLMAGPRQAGIAEADLLADRVLHGMYWTSVTDRYLDGWDDFPDYLGGLIGFAWDWSGTDDDTLTPPARATGLGFLEFDPVPVDYQDLHVISIAAQRDPRWQGVLESATDLLLDAEIAGSGLFYNGLLSSGEWTGDFENLGTTMGEHLKVIQVLWIAIHLARVADAPNLDSNRRTRARAAARRSLAWFRTFYTQHGRVPEYLTMSGQDVPACTAPNVPDLCLRPDWENLVYGEARIYALLARLALRLGEQAYAVRLVEDHILPDRISNPADPRYGLIGVSTASHNDAEAWNVLESLLTMCQVAGGE